jgi:uncharacterized protein (DUF983 family)
MALRRRRDTVIDLTDAARRREGHPVFGAPDRCPTCGGGSYLERIDLRRRVQQQRCRACGLRFETTDVAVDGTQEQSGA